MFFFIPARGWGFFAVYSLWKGKKFSSRNSFYTFVDESEFF